MSLKVLRKNDFRSIPDIFGCWLCCCGRLAAGVPHMPRAAGVTMRRAATHAIVLDRTCFNTAIPSKGSSRIPNSIHFTNSTPRAVWSAFRRANGRSKQGPELART